MSQDFTNSLPIDWWWPIMLSQTVAQATNIQNRMTVRQSCLYSLVKVGEIMMNIDNYLLLLLLLSSLRCLFHMTSVGVPAASKLQRLCFCFANRDKQEIDRQMKRDNTNFISASQLHTRGRERDDLAALQCNFVRASVQSLSITHNFHNVCMSHVFARSNSCKTTDRL